MKLLSTSLTLLLAFSVVAFAQEQSSEHSNPMDMTIKNAVATINQSDAQFQERQDEVLESPEEEPMAEEGEADEVETNELEADVEQSDLGVVVESNNEEAISEESDHEAVLFLELENDEVQSESDTDEKAPEASFAEPDLPETVEFDVPEDDVFLELPGAVEESAAMDKDAETISIDFPQEDVRNILRNVADLYELNVVIPDGLTGSVSIKLRDVTWRQVFDVVLEPLNHTYIEDGNIIKVKSMDELLVEPVDTRVFVINFAKASEIQGSVQPLVDASTGGKIQVDKRSNALVITERPSRMNGIQEIIETLDRPTEQVMIESKFVEITNRDSKNLGIDWAALSGWGASAGPFGRNYTDSKGSVSGNTYSDGFTANGGQLELVNEETTFDNFTRDLNKTDTALFSADQFGVVISALKTNTDVELISNPTVVTLNNTAAEINIGEEFPIPSYSFNEEQGTFEVSNFEYKNIGINLKVTPQINSAGFINLNITPEISSRTGEVLFGGASAATIPIITTRKTQSSVTIKSGYTLAIGGLIEKNSENGVNKVPVLGSVPVLGKMFRSESTQVDQRNLIVFITAKILSASGATYRDVFSQRTLYEMGIKARDLPGYEPPATERELFDNIQETRDDMERLETEFRLRQQLNLLNETKEEEFPEKQESNDREFPRRFR